MAHGEGLTPAFPFAGAASSLGARSPQVEFVKSVGMLKGVIEGGAISSTKKTLLDW